ncbi:MAG: hypothetical protein K2K16_07290 [Ruminococcus sp.]|nr:hypothetical protein [Ruminococcus sp.]
MKNETRKKLEDIARRYAKHGVDMRDCINLFNMGLPLYKSEEASVIGLRLALAKRFNEHDYFTSEDVAIVSGASVEEVNQHIEDNKEELMNNGSIVEVSSSIPGLFDKK